MKHWYTILISFITIMILAAIIGFSIYAQDMLERDSKYLTKLIDKIADDVNNESWEDVNNYLEEVSNKWSDVSPVWAAFIDHQEIDNISSTLSRLQVLAVCKDRTLLLSEAAVLKEYISHIPEKEKLYLENIF